MSAIYPRRPPGRDLDVPANTDETQTDAMGQGDEENKYYSLGGDDNDGNESGDRT